jgi:uncharacterized repeat protein (TIGR02543 family)
VTFNANNGTGSMSPQIANAPTALTLNTFTRLGYSFNGWNTLANGTGVPYANGATYSFAADLTLYAQWTALPNHTVTFNANNGTGSMSPQTTNVPTALTLNTFTRLGYSFSGWNTLAVGGGTAYADGATYSFSAELTLYAQWTALPNHTVTFNANNGTGTMSPQIANAPTALTLNTFTRLGYSFSGWNTLAVGGGTAYSDGATYSFSTDVTLYAQWTALPTTCYSLTLSHTGLGNNPIASPVNSAGCQTGQYVANTSINLSGATPDTGWQIASWTGTNRDTSTDSTNIVIMPASTHIASVNYTQYQYSLTINSLHGEVTKSPDKPTYVYGDVVKLTAIPATGWIFSAWSGDLNLSVNPISILINGNKTVTASFTQTLYTLSVNVVGSGSGSVSSAPVGIDCSTACSYDFAENTIVELTATPTSPSIFVGWSGGNCPGTGTCTVTMDAAKSVTANFTYIWKLVLPVIFRQ